jgi:dihydrofolate synthase / folylpolyglutamate synthase
MKVTPVRTERVAAGQVSVTDLLDAHLAPVPERSIVAVTSKVVSLCENRVVRRDSTSKLALVAAESERYLATASAHGFHFTVTGSTLIPAAGIDESNGGGDYILWPRDPQAAANDIRRHLRHRFGVRQLGTIITDSTCTPLRRGTSGICLAHSGFAATRDYVGEPDLFARPLRVSQANIVGGLAAAAVLTMGEGAERTPVCVIEDVPFVQFQDHDPTAEEIDLGRIPLDEDLFAPFLSAADWTPGARAAPAEAGED